MGKVNLIFLQDNPNFLQDNSDFKNMLEQAFSGVTVKLFKKAVCSVMDPFATALPGRL